MTDHQVHLLHVHAQALSAEANHNQELAEAIETAMHELALSAKRVAAQEKALEWLRKQVAAQGGALEAERDATHENCAHYTRCVDGFRPRGATMGESSTPCPSWAVNDGTLFDAIAALSEKLDALTGGEPTPTLPI